MKDTNNSLAMIIGGSSGMGLATAKQLLNDGVDVVIVTRVAVVLEVLFLSAQHVLLSLSQMLTAAAGEVVASAASYARRDPDAVAAVSDATSTASARTTPGSTLTQLEYV